MKKKLIGLSICMLLISTVVLPVSGTLMIDRTSKPLLYGGTLYVGGSGPGNYTKIQDAIDDASDGDTVFVYDDSSPYFENVVVNKSINLVGEDKYMTVIDGEKKDDVVFVSVDSVSIVGFTIQNSSKESNDAGIKLYSNYSIIQKTIISNNHYGIVLRRSSYNTIFNNAITLNQRTGVRFQSYSNHNVISGNTIGPFNHYGIELIACKNNTISGNVIEDNWGEGMHLFSDNNIITGNIISYNGHDAISIAHSKNNNIISNNTIEANNGIGVYIQYSAFVNNMIIDNKISYNWRGIFLLGINGNTTILRNKINSNSYGVGIEDTSNTRIIRNHFNYNHIGLHLYSSSDTFVSENSIDDNIKGVELQDSLRTEICCNNFRSNSQRHAVFFNCTYTVWKSNFWHRSRILPKPIFGIMKIGFFSIPWVNFDWNPAQEPYDI